MYLQSNRIPVEFQTPFSTEPLFFKRMTLEVDQVGSESGYGPQIILDHFPTVEHQMCGIRYIPSFFEMFCFKVEKGQNVGSWDVLRN